MARFDNRQRREGSRSLLHDQRGSSLLEFAVVLPLLVVFVVGIYDFSGALGEKQKIQEAAQQGAIVAGAQPMGDISTGNANQNSLQPVVTAVFNSLAASGVLTNANQGSCQMPAGPPAAWAAVPASGTGLTWTYPIAGCSAGYPSDNLTITINRGVVSAGPPATVGTSVQISYPYRSAFGSVIQLVAPGPQGYGSPTLINESATVHNQM